MENTKVNRPTASAEQIQQLLHGVPIDDTGTPARALSAEVLGHELVPRGGGMPGVARKIQIRAAWRMESRTEGSAIIL